MKTLSIIIPAYNEETHIIETLDEILREDVDNPFSLTEIVVVDDGSADNTKSMVDEYSLRDERVRCESYGDNRGKGKAVAYGMDNTSGDYKIFLDADGATHISSVNDILTDLYENEYDIVIGSRSKTAGGEIVERQSSQRSQLGSIGVVLINKVLRLPIRDTQCGCKVFRRDVADDLFSKQKINGWMFDCEVLYKAHKKGYEMKERGVKWSHKDNSKVKLSSYPKSLFDLIRIKIHNL